MRSEFGAHLLGPKDEVIIRDAGPRLPESVRKKSCYGLLAGWSAVMIVACSSAEISNKGDDGSTGGGAGAGLAQGTAGMTRAGAGGSSASADANTQPTNVSIAPTPLSEAGTCAAIAQQTEAVTVQMPVTETVTETSPIAIYIMLDRSLSMEDGNPSKWTQASQAIDAFAADPASAGMDVGLGFFPPVPGAGACNGSDCGMPVVPIAPLPQNATAVTMAMAQTRPGGLTPMECGLRGAIDQCKSLTASTVDASTGEQCVVILVSDGAPTLCELATNNLAAIAANGKTAGVLVFTLGLQGTDFQVLDAIAQAGGTNCDPTGGHASCDARAGEAAFLNALSSIRHSVAKTVTKTVTKTVNTSLSCQWVLPHAPSGQAIDPGKVNVRFTDGSGMSHDLGAVSSAAACSQVADGWYYDDPSMPKAVIACPQTCDTVSNANNARVEILIGCDTTPAPVH